MSEKIVIIGNGFDLRHFLPTKYNHLITILREIETLDFNIISKVSFENLFGKLFKEKDKEFYEKINEFYETSEIIFNIQELKSIQDRIKINNWFQYLKSVEDNKIETWIDFETEIIRVLFVISNYFELFNDERFDKINEQVEFKHKIHYIVYKNSDRSFFKNKFQKNILGFFNLISINNSDYSLLNNDYIVVIDNEIQYFREKDFFDEIYKSLEKFVGIFNDYIENVVNVFYEYFKEDKKENFIALKNDFLFDKVSRIYSFNYTNTFTKLYSFKDSQKEKLRKISKNIDLENHIIFNGIDFLHGKSIKSWDNNLEKLEIVLGVNDIDPLLKNHKLFQFTKYFQKLHKNTDYLFLDEKIQNIEGGLIYDEFEFYFWGHSLDVSDKEYIEDIFKIVKDTRSRIKIFYHSISGKADQLKNLLNIIDKNIIESMMKKNKLTFIESTPENLFEEL